VFDKIKRLFGCSKYSTKPSGCSGFVCDELLFLGIPRINIDTGLSVNVDYKYRFKPNLVISKVRKEVNHLTSSEIEDYISNKLGERN